MLSACSTLTIRQMALMALKGFVLEFVDILFIYFLTNTLHVINK